MKLLFAFVCLGFTAGSLENQLSELGWEEFKLQFNKHYTSIEEELQRKQIFLKAQEEVKAHNALYDQGVYTYTIGINTFSDRFPEERKARNCLRLDLDDSEGDAEPFDIDIERDLPDSIDWREKGAVTEVKDQGECGSCWAFSATGALEGQHFLKTKKLVSLSEQNLIDCDKKDDGCEGGLPSNAFQYVKNNGGIDTEASYPYKERKEDKCHYNPKNSGSNCTGFIRIPTGNETLLKAAVAKIGPVSVCISVNNDKFGEYTGGVYYDSICSCIEINHAVLVVGYGTAPNGSDYWIVKNSWGKRFGMKGYIYMSRNRENNCQIASLASYPKV